MTLQNYLCHFTVVIIVLMDIPLALSFAMTAKQNNRVHSGDGVYVYLTVNLQIRKLSNLITIVTESPPPPCLKLQYYLSTRLGELSFLYFNLI